MKLWNIKNIVYVCCIMLFLLSCSGEREDLLFKEKALNGEEIKILALGDSITYGYKVKPEESYPSQLEKKLQSNGYNYSIKNFGVSGNTSAQLLDRLDEILENNEADMVILCIGGNDGLRKKSISDMKKNINDIIDKIEEKDIHIVLAGMELPIIFGWDYSGEFKDAFVDIAENRNLDFYDYFLDGIGLTVEYNQSDQIHPTALGYTVISDNIYKFLEDEGLLITKRE